MKLMTGKCYISNEALLGRMLLSWSCLSQEVSVTKSPGKADENRIKTVLIHTPRGFKRVCSTGSCRMSTEPSFILESF